MGFFRLRGNFWSCGPMGVPAWWAELHAFNKGEFPPLGFLKRVKLLGEGKNTGSQVGGVRTYELGGFQRGTTSWQP